jgi:hypothetical protein
VLKSICRFFLLATVLAALLSACDKSPASAFAEPPAAQAATTKPQKPQVTSVVTPPVVLWNGQVTQNVITTVPPTFLSDKEVFQTSYIETKPHSGVMVQAGTAGVAGKTSLQTAIGPIATVVGIVGSARIVGSAITTGANTLGGAIDRGAATTADGMQSVGDGLTANADAMQSVGDQLAASTGATSKALCMLLPAPQIATCLAQLQ